MYLVFLLEQGRCYYERFVGTLAIILIVSYGGAIGYILFAINDLETVGNHDNCDKIPYIYVKLGLLLLFRSVTFSTKKFVTAINVAD